MIDFVAEYMKIDYININDIPLGKANITPKTTDIDKVSYISEAIVDDKHVKQLLDKLTYDKIIEREDWFYIGSVLKNMEFDYKLFCEYSQKMPNHDPCTCESVFKSLTKKVKKYNASIK